MKSSLSVWYTNATSLNNKYDELIIEIELKNPDLIMISETWWTETSAVNVPGYCIYKKDREKGKGGGVCIYVTDRVKSYDITEDKFDNNEQIWYSLEIVVDCRTKRSSVGVYIDPVLTNLMTMKN